MAVVAKERVPAVLPYIRGLTDKIGYILKRASIKTYYKPPKKISQLLPSVKCKIPLQVPGVYVVAAKRTPFGKYGGLLKDFHPADLVAVPAKDALKAANLLPTLIDTVNIGQEYVLSGSSDGGLTPRHAALKIGVPEDKPVLGLNRMCGSGFQSVITSAQEILTGAAQISLAGGTESMSSTPYLVRHTRFGAKLWSEIEFEDYLTKMGIDTYCGLFLTETAENLAEKFNLKRREVDDYALLSQQRWKIAYDKGVFKQEITPVTVKVREQEFVMDKDEHPRPNTTAEGLAKLPALFKKGGVQTAGNSSGVNDGAGALILASEEAVKQHQLTPLARLVGWSCVGVEPSIMGIAPVPAIQNLLKATKMTLDDIDIVEINETFSAQTIACAKALELDLDRLNVNGGAIAIGHPPGCTGTRISAHLVHELRRRGVKTLSDQLALEVDRELLCTCRRFKPQISSHIFKLIQHFNWWL